MTRLSHSKRLFAVLCVCFLLLSGGLFALQAREAVTLNADPVVPEVAFAAMALPITLGNFIWADADFDGVQDAGEPGIPGVTVQLWDSTKTTQITSTLTNASGIYSLTVTTPGSYRVRVVLPAGYVAYTLKQDAAATGSTDSDINRSGADLGFTDAFTVTTGSVSTTNLDAGLLAPVTIGNFIWNDLDHDGQQDAGEPGINAVPIALYRYGTNQLVGTTTTNPSGIYQFTVAPGAYYLKLTIPAGYSVSPPNNADDSLDSDFVDMGDGTAATDFFLLSTNPSTDLSFDAGMYLLPTPTITPPAVDVNLVTNGTFASGLNGWTFYDSTRNVTNGELVIAPTAAGGGFYQQINFGSGGEVFEVNFRARNASMTAKTMNVILRDTDYNPSYNCVFSMPANTPFQFYRLHVGTSEGFYPMMLQFALSGDNTLGLVFDDITLVRKASNGLPGTVCTVFPPSNQELVFNGAFDAGTGSWAAFNATMNSVNIGGANGNIMQIGRNTGTTFGGFYQFSPYSAPANAVFQFNFQMGNQSAQNRVINMLVRSEDWLDMHSCFINLPPNTPLTNFTILLKTTKAWSNIVMQGWIQVGDYVSGPPPFRFDNISLQYLPSSGFSGSTQCPAPLPLPQRPTVMPSPTLTPSLTATYTATSTETATFEPSATPVPTDTATDVPTPEPPTLTPVPTDTAAHIPTAEPPTGTPEPPTNTPEPPPEVTQNP